MGAMRKMLVVFPPPSVPPSNSVFSDLERIVRRRRLRLRRIALEARRGVTIDEKKKKKLGSAVFHFPFDFR